MIKTIGVIVGVLVLLGLVIGWQIFRYKECKMVGHSTLYCIINIGSK